LKKGSSYDMVPLARPRIGTPTSHRTDLEYSQRVSKSTVKPA